MIFGFGRGRQKVENDDDDEDQEEEFVLFQGSYNGNNPDLTAHGRLVQAGLLPAKKLVSDALSVRADMIRLDIKAQGAIATIYIDSAPTAPTKMPALQGQAVSQMIRLLAGIDIKVKAPSQTGSIKAEYNGTKYELRVNNQAVEGGERLTIRALDPNLKLEKPRDIGFSEALIEKIRGISSSKSGLILAASPPFSGLTTLKLALMRCSDAYMYSIYFLADIGRELSYVKMYPPNEGDDFARTMQRARREDADILVTDPIDKADDAKAVLECANECAVISDLHAKDAGDGILKLVKLTGDPQLVADQLRLVASQMFIRALCKKCRRAYRPNASLLGKIGLPPETRVLYRPTIAGMEQQADEEEASGPTETCRECNGLGYKGKLGLLEIIEMTEGMKAVVAAGADIKAIRKQARTEKMQTFHSDGLRMVVEGNTSLEELQRAFRTQ
ncbi:ATPase, T2SS/T4P/T4SS family [Planctomicrobium piriforme]|uniref:Type IV pilus assembly protein PilB n=1 Tax=Planctomicrobium piriforme TaxID=1576369 RepID=A0A1I3FF26_9PLAN|nr:ATPase, T2SS/T4P/T4SS family [Planctomicrobium piriforme]SFI09833.1 type IV pilus assembly protein PilB [Planctomicrobium piriforme]